MLNICQWSQLFDETVLSYPTCKNSSQRAHIKHHAMVALPNSKQCFSCHLSHTHLFLGKGACTSCQKYIFSKKMAPIWAVLRIYPPHGKSIFFSFFFYFTQEKKGLHQNQLGPEVRYKWPPNLGSEDLAYSLPTKALKYNIGPIANSMKLHNWNSPPQKTTAFHFKTPWPHAI